MDLFRFSVGHGSVPCRPLLFLFSTLFVIFFSPLKQKWINMDLHVCIKVYYVDIEVIYYFFLSKKVVINAIFGVILFLKICVCVKFVPISKSGVH